MAFILTRAPLALDISTLGPSTSIPTASYPVIVGKSLDGNAIKVRTASVVGGAPGDYDETLLRNPRGVLGNTSDGWFVCGRRVVAGGKSFTGSAQPSDWGKISNADFAYRQGPYSDAYTSGGEGPIYAYCGIEHTRALWRDSANAAAPLAGQNSNMTLDGAGANLLATAAFPAGTLLRGQRFDLLMNLDLLFFPQPSRTPAIADGTVGTACQYAMSFTSTGLKRQGYIAPVGSNTGHNDWYPHMYPANTDCDRIKLSGGTPIALTRPAAIAGQYAPQYPAYPGWNTTDVASTFSFYRGADPSIMDTFLIDFAAPIRRSDFSDTPYALNSAARATVIDNPDNSKLYIYAASSAESPPRTAWLLNAPYRWQNTLRGRVSAAGPL